MPTPPKPQLGQLLFCVQRNQAIRRGGDLPIISKMANGAVYLAAAVLLLSTLATVQGASSPPPPFKTCGFNSDCVNATGAIGEEKRDRAVVFF